MSQINLALVLWNQGKRAEAEILLRQALGTQRKLFDNEHPHVAVSLNNLALVLRDQGKLAEAETSAREALAMEIKLFGAEHPDVANFMDSLGVVLRDQRKLSEAETLHREAVAMQKKLQGNEALTVAVLLDNLATVMRDQGKLAEAEALYCEALAIRRKHTDHPDVDASLHNLALVLVDQGKLAEAETAVRECLALREEQLPDDWQTFDARSLLGSVLLRQNRVSDAEPLLLSGYEGMKQREVKIPAYNRVRVKEGLQRLVQVYEATAQPGKAAEWQKRLAEFDKSESERKAATPSR
jgi:tetratricopeptide (TPR) repeat protein